MYFIPLASLLPFLMICNCDCSSLRTDKKVLELKTDVEKIGNDFENLAFDVMEQIIDKVNGDYYTSDESESKETSIERAGNATQVGKPTTRLKRSIDEDNFIASNISEASIEDKNIILEASFNDTSCPSKSVEEQNLERRHIEDLKEEVKKLYDLVVLLKDQQKIMSLLDQETKHLDSDISKRFDAKDLLTVLDHVNNQDTDTVTQRTEKKPTHEELEQIKFDLRSAINALNRTKEILSMERRKEVDLENELKDHRVELNFLKVMVQKLYENKTVSSSDNVTSDQIVGAPPVHLPKELPTTKETVSKNKTDLVKNKDIVAKSRSSEADDLEQLLHQLRKPKTDDLESKMVELKKEIEAKKQAEDLLKQLDILQKFIADRKETQNLPNEDSVLVKRLLAALKKQQPQQSKVIDDDVEVELEKLQNAIDNLRPKDEWDTKSEKNDIRLQHLLRLLSQEGKKDDVAINNNSPVSPKQIADLRKQLDQMAGVYPSNGYGYGQFAGTVSGKYTCKVEASPQSNSDIKSSDPFGRGQSSQFFSSYPQLQTNGLFNNAPPSNIPYNTYAQSPGDAFKLQNFGATSNLRPSDVSSASAGYNRNILVPPIQVNSLGGNVGQNGYQFQSQTQQKQFGATGEYNIKNIPNPQYQGLSELHRKLFGAGAAQGSVQTDNRQFFLAPQPNVYEKIAPNPVPAQGNAAGDSQEKPRYYPQQNTGNADYRYQKIQDLTFQVNGLQNVINNLNKPGYVQRPEDRDTIVNLERQINDLKGIMTDLSQDIYAPNGPGVFDQRNHQQQKAKRRRSTEDNQLSLEDSDLYDQVVTSLRKIIFENDTQKEARTSGDSGGYYDDVQAKIADLKSQLENHLHRSGTQQIGQRRFSPYSHPPPYHGYNLEHPTTSPKLKNDLVQPKKNDVFTSIVLKILDKLLASLPAVLQRLLGYGIGQFFSSGDSNTYGDGYGVGYGGGENSIQGIFNSLGIFGYLPLIVLKIIDGITVFVNILRKNKFFKNFLLPAVVLLLVAGSVLFLIWWLHPDEHIGLISQEGYNEDNNYNKNYGQYSEGYQNYGYNNNPNNDGYKDNNYGAKRSYNYPVYSRSYFDNNR